MKAKNQTEHKSWMLFIGIVGIVTLSSYFVLSPQKLFKPGDDIGYNLGLVGGILMLILLIYPLRKRFKFLSNVGLLPNWFKWHMVLGILGPLAIIFHSTYHINSVNAAVAMFCMFLVSGSGTFGRFFYTKIHNGLYGRQTTVNELRAALEETDEAKSVFNFAPSVEKAMEEFRARYEGYDKQRSAGYMHFIRVGYQAGALSRALSKELHHIMKAQANEKKYNAQQLAGMEMMFVDYRERITSYLRAVRDASQFHTYERLFSYWHIFHIPLVYMMVFSAVYHVYAVHAY